MNTATLLLLGVAGGAVRGIMHAYDCMTEWLNGRQQYPHAPNPGTEGPPAFGAFYDVGGESIAAVVHALLGALVAGLLGTSGQVSGGFAVFAAGASAPLVLVQLKNSRLAEAILGEGTAPAAAGAAQPADTASNGPGQALDSTQETLSAQRPGTGTPIPPPVRRPPPSGSSSQLGRARGPAADQDGAG
ncbi:hypothetical protein [Streptomyces sp. SAS_270]|uniref:hypothetical protein n=1 Tax=Streptomyces sp. SAS_270 TaxID=3412748 RepID=UPI00403C433F